MTIARTNVIIIGLTLLAWDDAPDDFDGSTHITHYYYNHSAGGFDPDDDLSLFPDTPRLVEEIYGESIYLWHYTSIPSLDLRIESQGTVQGSEDWATASNLFTTNRYYTNGPFSGMLKSVVRPDKTLQTFAYTNDSTGFYRTNLTAMGQPNSTFAHVVDGTTNVTVLDLAGHTVSSSSWDVASGLLLSQDTYGDFDALGRPQSATHLDGTTENTTYSCCGVDTTTDRDGVTTYYTYDAMKRLVATTRLGITTTNVLNAPGRTIKAMRIGSSGSVITQSQSQYDTAGQLIRKPTRWAG